MCVSCIASGAMPSNSETLTKTLGDQVTNLRLVAAPGLKHGAYDAGIDITMAPGSHTYWKMPGDAGVPPVFSFDGSKNIARADVLFPAPSRITEQGLEAFGYTDHVVFPVSVAPADAAKPAVLHVDVTYAVCNKICIPAHGDASLELAPRGHGEGAGLVATALAKVPVPIQAAERADLVITRDKDAPKPTWILTWKGKVPVEDVFADAPEGFYFDTRKRGPATWTLTAAQIVGSPKGKPVPVSLTLAREDGSLLATESLEVAAPTQ